jgi:hypothetical protein
MRKLYYILTAALAALALSACNSEGDDFDLDLKADSFLGGTPSNVSGPDADNADATDEASAMLTGRKFDFTPNGFTLASGNVNSEPVENSDYGIAGGTMSLDGDEATVGLDVFSNNPDVTNAEMTGTFSVAEASSAILTPGESFTVNWDIAFDYLGFPIQLNMDQELQGTDFTEDL